MVSSVGIGRSGLVPSTQNVDGTADKAAASQAKTAGTKTELKRAKQ